LNSQGLVFEAREVHRCLNAGLLESPLVSHASTLAVMETMDQIRQQIGLKFPTELLATTGN